MIILVQQVFDNYEKQKQIYRQIQCQSFINIIFVSNMCIQYLLQIYYINFYQNNKLFLQSIFYSTQKLMYKPPYDTSLIKFYDFHICLDYLYDFSSQNSLLNMSPRFPKPFHTYFDCIKQIDLFGIPITLKAFDNQRIFKSNIGGITTFFIYSFYLSYLIYVLILWQTNQIQPTSVRFSEGKNITSFNFQEDTIFEICYWKYSEGIVDPFSEQDNVLMPLLMYYLDGVQQPPVSLLSNTRKSKYNSSLIQVNNLYLTTNNNFEQNIRRQEGFIIIIDCDETYLVKGQSCASQEHVKLFKQQINYISFFTYVQTFNTHNINTQKVSYEYYMSLEYDTTFMMSVQLQQVRTFVNVGILFQNVLQFNYIESYETFFQQQSLESSVRLQGRQFYLGYQLRLNPMEINQDIRYSNIGEILAQVGSILSVLMMFKSLIQYYQNIILDNIIYYQVLNQWFPDQIRVNKFGVISSVAGYKQKYQLDKFTNLAASKLDVINIIHQIQRIELVLIKNFGRNELQEANSYVIQPHALLGTENPYEREAEFYLEDLKILKYNYK
ncbi:hypothetical protein pb186bvf_021125 [Paramecium bursaria]